MLSSLNRFVMLYHLRTSILKFNYLCCRTVSSCAQTMAKPRVVFVLGAPGSGKGTQCSLIVDKYGYTHLSAGDLLRQERNDPESSVGQLIDNHIKEGTIVPVKITCELLEKAIKKSGNSKILIDGFPRNKENLTGWNDQMDGKADVDFVLFFDCPEEVCTERILKRAETSGRKDDNMESLKKRFKTYSDETMSIIKHYTKEDKVRTVHSDRNTPAEKVFENVKKFFSV